MNPADMIRLLDSIAQDRNIDRNLLLQDLEEAMKSAARKHFNSLDVEEFGCRVDPMTGEITMWRNVYDDIDDPDAPVRPEPIALEDLGRIPAQTAKQVMIQRFREDERDALMADFGKRKGEIVTGTMQRVEGGALIVQIDRAEGFMPRSEQIPGEQFHNGDRVRCLILDVREQGTQVKIVLSRGDQEFIRRLFELEVPEVSERVIEIRAMSREPGFRTKVAVASIDSKVDPVGACVGVRGSRIRNIVDELGGEKIDIVRWNESSQVLIANALKPAEVEEVSLCFELGRGTVVVREDQLSLAIGRRGQNVRLAARLTGWDLDILTPDEFAKGLEALDEVVQGTEGIEGTATDRLAAFGMISVFDVEEVGVEMVAEELEIDPAVAQTFIDACSARGKIISEEQARAKEEEARRQEEGESEGPADAEAAAAAILGGFEDLPQDLSQDLSQDSPQDQPDGSADEVASDLADSDEVSEGAPAEEAAENASEQEG